MQQTEYADVSPEVIESPEPANLTKTPSASESNEQWQRITKQASTFLTELPDYISKFFNENKQLLATLGIVFASIIALRIVFAIIDVFNNIPLLAPTFQIIGLCYSVWFVNRYLLRASNRQELAQELQTLKEQVIGSQQ